MKHFPSMPFLEVGCGVIFQIDRANAGLVTPHLGALKQNDQKPLRLASDFFGGGYSSHVSEKLPRSVARFFLKGCFRVLRSGGVLRVVVPDLEANAQLYRSYFKKTWTRRPRTKDFHEWLTLELLDQITREMTGGEILEFWRRRPLRDAKLLEKRVGGDFRRAISGLENERVQEEKPRSPRAALRFRRSGGIHRPRYEGVSLRMLIEQTVLACVKVCRADEYGIPNFPNYHRDTDMEGRVRKPNSLFTEGVKP
jgi:hypothetical protein